MNRTKLAGWLACALVALALPSWSEAQATRTDAIWARTTAGQPITLDGVLDEFAWTKAESYLVRYGVNNGDPGSGWKIEAGRIPRDSTYATLKFLVNGNKLYLGAVMRDSSIGGSALFNRFDGLLMAIKDHRDPFATIAGPVEYLYSFWHPEDPNPDAVGKLPGFRGYWSTQSDTIPRTPEQIAAWDAVTRVRGGQSNSDATNDSSWVVEMMFDVGVMGYTPTVSSGDIIEWNISIYDTDWFWPLSGPRFSSNRAWWQGPWGNQMHYNEVRIHTRPSVTISSGPVPFIGPEVRIPNAGGHAVPNIDGFLTDPVWAITPGFDMRYGDFSVRDTYPGVMRWRAGFYQPPVNGGEAGVADPGDATIKWFFKGDSLYIGFDVRDQVVQNGPTFDRYDGFIVTLQDTAVRRDKDQNRESRRLGFHVGPAPSGAVVATDYLPFMRDTMFAAKVGLKLKPGTTVDTLGSNVDQGYTAELMVNLRALGFPAGLGTKPLYIGIDMQDGDSFIPFTDSYGTRSWWGREYEHECCPANAYLDPNLYVTGVETEAIPARSGLIGNYPNPFRASTMMKFALSAPARVTLEVYDLQGRQVARRGLGLHAAGARQAAFTRAGLGTGIYLYRLKLADPVSGASRGSMAGKMMILE